MIEAIIRTHNVNANLSMIHTTTSECQVDSLVCRIALRDCWATLHLVWSSSTTIKDSNSSGISWQGRQPTSVSVGFDVQWVIFTLLHPRLTLFTGCLGLRAIVFRVKLNALSIHYRQWSKSPEESNVPEQSFGKRGTPDTLWNTPGCPGPTAELPGPHD